MLTTVSGFNLLLIIVQQACCGYKFHSSFVSNKQIIQLDNFCLQNNFSRLQSKKNCTKNPKKYTFFVGWYDFDSISHPFAIANFLAHPVSSKQQHVSYLLASLFGIIDSQQKPEMKLYIKLDISLFAHTRVLRVRESHFQAKHIYWMILWVNIVKYFI